MKKALIAQMTGVAAGIALMATGCGTSGGTGSQEGLQEVSVGYIADYNGAALMAIADQEGYWADAGLEPNYVTFTNGPLTIQALGTDNIDVGYIGSGALWLPAQNKAEVWSINSVSNADRIVAQPGIESLSDLKGKKIGVPAGTSGDLLLSLALESEGMSRDDVEVVNMDPSTAVSAFASNQVDAAALWFPLIDTLKESRPDLVELAANEDFMPQSTFPSAFVAQEGRGAEDPELAKAVISVIKQANNYRYENQEETVAATAEFLKLDAAAMQAQADVATLYTSQELESFTEDGTVAGWFDGLQEQFVQQEKLEAAVDAEEMYTTELYLDASSE